MSYSRWRTEVLRKASSFSPNIKPRVAGNAATFGNRRQGKDSFVLFCSDRTLRCRIRRDWWTGRLKELPGQSKARVSAKRRLNLLRISKLMDAKSPGFW